MMLELKKNKKEIRELKKKQFLKKTEEYIV